MRISDWSSDVCSSDLGISADNQPYLALDYVDGEPITDWCRTRALDVPACVRLFMQVCEAVSHAHANLIVHRDLKPSNILVTRSEEHTSELQSLMRISYAVFCLKKKQRL